MTRFAPAPLKKRERKDPPQAVAPVVPARRAEDAQDRFGAQATFDAGRQGLSSDPWSEMAEIVVRLIRAPAAPGSEPSIDEAAASRRTSPPRPTKEPQQTIDAPEPSAAGELSTVPLDPVKAPSNDPLYALLSGEEHPPPGSKIDVPKFPHAKGVAAPSGGTGGGGGPVSTRKGRKPPTQATTGESPGEEEKPEFIVHQWQGAVNSAASGMSMEKVAVRSDLAADVDTKKKGAQDRNKKARDGLADDALSNVPKAPEVENPPPPPPSNPVPEQTERILAASGKRLDDQIPPPLEWSPKVEDKAEALTIEPKQPVIGEQAVPAELFQVLISPKAQEAAALPKSDAKGADGKRDPEAAKVEAALKQLSNTGEVKVPKGEGEQIISKDTGPEPMPPLPPALEVPVGQVVARLLARAEQTSKEVLDGLRTQAYTGGVLKKHFPEIGESMLGDLSQQVNTELRDIAAAANITADQLETMIGERRKELATSTDQAKKEAETKGTEAVDATSAEGQKTMDAVAGAAKAAEEETLRRQEAAGGASDPTVINRRRDLTVNWITEHVTTQTTNYQLAGEKRTRELGGVRKQQTEAYKALVQRVVYQIMTPDTAAGRKARDTNDAARERRLADLSMGVKAWEDEVLKRVGEMFRKSIKFIEDQAKANRNAVESAGTAGREAARRWAEDKILAGQSWWKRFIARIQRWLGEADNLNEEWRVRRTRENRDAIVNDLQTFEKLKGQLAKYASEDAIEADKALTDAQKALLKEAFRRGNPLDFAAERLKQTITASHLAAARGIFEKELFAVPPTGENADKLNEIVHGMGDTGFDGAKIAQECHAAMDQWGTDEDRIFRNLKGLTAFKGMVVRKYYTARGWGNLDSDLDSELSGDEYRRAQAQIDGKQAAADAIGLHDAIAGLGTDEKAIMELLRNKTPEEVEAIRAEYQSRYGETLDAALKDDLDEGNEIDQATALMSGDTATADAIALDDAMRGGIVSSGTDEAEIEKIQTRVRDEVLARATAENWTSEQREAEVRRRMAAIEKRFGDRYSDVEQYNEPGLTGGSVLKRAFASELSGSELDLANALQDNDLIKADAARIEIERTGFYASDDKLLKVMRSQYERALEARRLDEGPARQMRVKREVDKLRDQKDPQLSEEEISKKRMALERQMEKEIDAGATKDAKVSTEALRGAYEGKYNRNLAYTLSFNMSGREHDTALALLKNGGKLSPLQEIELATRGDGTEEDVLKKTLKTMTKAEIEVVRRQWEARHPGKSFDEMIRGELSGRDESDIMDMVEHGAPESAKEQIAQEVRRVKRERDDLTGIVGRSAAGSEDEWMQFQVKRLQELETDLDRKDWPPGKEGRRQREELMGKVEFRVQRVQDSVEDHRRKIDSVTDSISQVASIVAAVVVGAIVTVLTAGTMGPAAIAAVVALASSMAATMATMATKRLVMGGAYGAEDFAVDLAVGVVDAVVSVATAGVGDKLLKVAKGVVSKLPVARIGGLVAKPMAALGTKVAASPLARVGTGIAESGLATRAMKTPFVGGALKSAGSSARQFGKVLTNPLEMEGAAARFLARSGENVLQSMPSTMTQVGLSDDTWKGDPFANFVSGMASGAWQSFYMGHMLAGPMQHASNSLTHGFGHIQTNIQMKTELGKLQVAGRLVQDGYSRFHAENPGASMGDFLAHPDGRKLRAEIEGKGLLPTVESVNKKVAADPAVKVRMEADGPGGAASAKAQSELRTAQLEAALPGPLREKALVSPDPTLTGNTVRVEPLRIGDRIVGVEVRVGPDATPLDVAMHAATVHTMQKYTGLAGQIRQCFENIAHWMGGSDVRVGKRGWEARLEMGKLPAIIDARLKALEGEMVTPDLARWLQADVDSLTRQFHEHEAIFHDDAMGGQEGRGYVAAEDQSPAQKRGRKAFEQGELKDGADGAITDAGRVDLAWRLAEARKLLHEARRLMKSAATDADNAAVGRMMAEAKRILNDAAKFYEYDYQMLYEHITTTGGHPDIAKELKLQAAISPEPIVSTGLAARDPAQVELDKMMDALRLPDPDGPHALIDRIRAGGLEGVRAQERLNAQSNAPENATLIDFSTATLETAFAAAGGVPESGREGGVRVEIHGIELFLFSPKPKGDDPRRGPPPTIAFEGTLPSKVNGKTAVYQFRDGELRLWHLEPSSENPHGRLVQEAIIGRGRERIGHENQFRTHGEDDLAGAPTELAHALGAGLRVESPFGISRAPYEVNQTLQAKGIEAYLRRLRDELPPGATLSYSPAITFHEGTMRPKRIDYAIDIIIQGKRVPFADFAIDVEVSRVTRAPQPDDPRTTFVKTRSSTADTLEWRYAHDSPRINELFTHLHEAVDIPRQVVEGIATPRPRDVVMAENLRKFPASDVAAMADTAGYAAHRPPSAASFDLTTWRDGLTAILSDKDMPTHIVVDLRELGLSTASIAAILDAVDRLPVDKHHRVVILQ